MKGEAKKTASSSTSSKPLIKKTVAATKVVDIPVQSTEKSISNKQSTKQGKAANNKNEPKPADFDEGKFSFDLADS
jgi:hypothetical protein